ncbi:putative HTH-type transcriptional regulator YtcD [Sporomusa ovata DSM 2662]|uniref:Transcriptional regulator, HxlR family n=1 Tax=Sporomusa ovata TaxID=2378 RepID=A0A0U1KVU7_9FIRM|nr:helix-turn-helix domain-containing protein [Sporomusa ovata]EQB29506.1 transcriptional regulator, HxlR family [Sporomusa ovata DSM 2662]CQR71557.1 Transcriptional regulator, HxlR family [Sporomusa ovata]
MEKCCTCEKCNAALKETLSIIGSKWTFLILWNLYEGTKQFSQLQKSLQGISPKTLSLRLHELEAKGVIIKTVYPEVPPRVEYSMTDKGNNLKDIFGELIKWSNNCLK